MEWLILTENQEKAAAFRKGWPTATCISTRGNPWGVEIKIEAGCLSHQRRIRAGESPTIEKIERNATEADRILLAFDPTSMGEAIAWEIEKRLGRRKCVRWGAGSLHPADIRKTIQQLESLEDTQLQKCNAGLAESWWCQAIMDIVWTASVTKWLETKTKRKERISRLMGGMLKAIAEEESQREMFRSYRYWEIRTNLKRPDGSGRYPATLIVPTFAQLSHALGKTREIWQRRLEEARSASINGTGIPQPEPGKPWRFKTLEDAGMQKSHMTKFPYFHVESSIEHEVEIEVRPALTQSAAIRLATKTERGSPEEVADALLWLYHQGHITQPRTNNPNLWKKTIEELIEFGTEQGWAMTTEIREFAEEETNTRALQAEAIRPTKWARSPEELEMLLPEEKTKGLRTWLYRIIYQRAVGSQAKAKRQTIRKHYLHGPLYLTKRGAAERVGQKFHVEREHALQAHMNVVLCAEEESEERKQKSLEGEILECTGVDIEEKRTRPPEKLSEERLFENMTAEGLGKRERLRKILKDLRAEKCVTGEEEIRLTENGRSLLQILNNHFGQFLEQNYHRTVAENLKLIEENRQEMEGFLQSWWHCFQTCLEEETNPLPLRKEKSA